MRPACPALHNLPAWLAGPGPEGEREAMEDRNGVDPNKDCGSIRCPYRCENCPFGIPERTDKDPTAIKC